MFRKYIKLILNACLTSTRILVWTGTGNPRFLSWKILFISCDNDSCKDYWHLTSKSQLQVKWRGFTVAAAISRIWQWNWKTKFYLAKVNWSFKLFTSLLFRWCQALEKLHLVLLRDKENHYKKLLTWENSIDIENVNFKFNLK